MQTLSPILRFPYPASLQERGRLLYTSKIIHPQAPHKQTPAEIFSKMIVIGDKHIPLAFQLRFHLKNNTELELDLHDEILTLKLVEGDGQMWKQVLKNYLNQKGFHETFKPIKKIGKGNFASVYLVEKIGTNSGTASSSTATGGLKQLYAVKAFSKEAAYSEQNGKECLIKEIEIMRQINHKHTMKLYEVYESENSLYFIFELIEGGSLHQKIKTKYRFKPFEVQGIIRDLLEGLKELHSKKIMHRDLKPENILIRRKDNLDCVIADFGLAEFSHSEMYLFTRCGTPGFVAPEVINIKDMKAKYEPICDLFSLGLIFYMLLFNKSLFKSKHYNDLVKENRESKFDFQEKEFSSIEPETKDLIVKMLRTDPEERISAEQALEHPYFRLKLNDEESSEESAEEEADTVDDILGDAKLVTPPLSQIQKNFRVKKDSCIEFKLGKENVMTGKTESVESLAASTKVSMGNSLLKGVKTSKFTAVNKKEERSK